MWTKYLSIRVMEPSFCAGFAPGDSIYITEKVDGANASIMYDSKEDKLRCYSRDQECTIEFNLRGFYEWVQTLNKRKFADLLGDKYCIYGEWLVEHTAKYSDDAYNMFYCFDIYDTEAKKFLPQDIVKMWADMLGLMRVPVLYKGTFISWDHVKSFIGKTVNGVDGGEGIVLKSMTNLNNAINKWPFYVKFVTDKFMETDAHKNERRINYAGIDKYIENEQLVYSIVTPARVRKMINKLVDDGVIAEDYTSDDFAIIRKNVRDLIYKDCVKEEPEIVAKVGKVFGKFCGEITNKIVEQIIEERNL